MAGREWVSAHVHRDRQQFLKANTGFVFTGAHGQPLDPDAVRYAFVHFCESHGRRPTRFHDLRHATASLLLARGIPPWQMSKILRHSSIAITTDTYGHLYSETSRGAADAISRFMAHAHERRCGAGTTALTSDECSARY